MLHNTKVLEAVNRAEAKLVAVTKYWDGAKTKALYDELKSNRAFYALGENRIETLQDKDLPREAVHFVGRIQSRKIAEIVRLTSAVHSLDNLKHAHKLNTIAAEYDQAFGVFIQVDVSGEPQKGGILPSELEHFITNVKGLENLTILGISGMGRGVFTESEKSKEFQELIHLRDQYLPLSIISAGTSRDYHIALKEGIELVRIGTSIVN